MFDGLKLSADVPPVWLAGFAALGWVLGNWVPLWRFDITPVGGIILWVGVAAVLWSAFWFWRRKTPIEPGHEPRALIVEGPYRLNRNPIYTGLVLILLGFALNQGALSALLPVIAFPILITRRFILPEEDLLRAAFGPDAEAYFLASRRW